MNGAQNAKYFKTGQYGKLYIVSGSHARGVTLKIFVLPDGVEAISNGLNNSPLNKDAVKVYGVVGGNPGWTEYYGWLHKGPWVDDFEALVNERKQLELAKKEDDYTARAERKEAERERENGLLSQY